MSSKLNIRTGDTVMVITGDEMKDRGKTGKVLKVYPEAQRVVVQGRKMIVRHQKPRQQGETGGRLEKEGTIHVSNVMLVCPKCGKATRVAHVLGDHGKYLRACKKCGATIDVKAEKKATKQAAKKTTRKSKKTEE